MRYNSEALAARAVQLAAGRLPFTPASTLSITLRAIAGKQQDRLDLIAQFDERFASGTLSEEEGIQTAKRIADLNLEIAESIAQMSDGITARLPELK